MSKRQWKRVLYENQPFPDNFIDPKRFFDHLGNSTRLTTNNSKDDTGHNITTNALDSLNKNNNHENVSSMNGVHNNDHTSDNSSSNHESDQRDRSCFSLLRSASVVAQQLSVVAVFLATYKFMIVYNEEGTTSLDWLVTFDIVLLTVGHIFHRALDTSVTLQPSLSESLRGVFLFGVCLRVAVPVVQTLTSSFSGNTIHALAIALSTIHLVFYDYSFVHDGDVEQFTGTVSLNASMFTAVILASRLDDVETVFSFMLLAVICFSFYPIVARLIYQRSLALHLAVTILQCILAGSLLFYLDFTLFAIFSSLVMFVWVVCPLFFKHMQQSYKKSFKGYKDWDIVDINTL